MAQTITRVIPDGDYPQRLTAKLREYEAALEDEKTGNALPLLNGEVAASVTLKDEYEALKAEAEADARAKNRIVTLRALGRQKWRDLKAAHPARIKTDDNNVDEDTAKGDRMAGLNADSVEDDLVFAAISEPKFADRAEYDRWANEELSEGEFQMLLRDAWSLVNIAQVDPKSLPSSPTRSNGGN